MCDNFASNDDSPEDEPGQQNPVRDLSLPPCEENTVEYSSRPPKGPPERKIHPRREVPPTPESPEEDERSESDEESGS